jgi:nucleolin
MGKNDDKKIKKIKNEKQVVVENKNEIKKKDKKEKINDLELNDTKEEKTSRKMSEVENLSDNDDAKYASKSTFISGIPYEATQEDVTKHFEDCGKIVHVAMPKYQDSGKNRGYAHILFEKTSSLKKAILKDKKIYIGSRYLTIGISQGVNETNRERKIDTMEIPADCRTIIVKNLDYNLDEKDLEQKFKPCGTIKTLRMVYHSSLGHFKGFAFIDFEKTQSVKTALFLHDKELNGRKMLVDFEDTKAKMGYKNKRQA